MTPRLESAGYVGGYRIRLRFADGCAGEIDRQYLDVVSERPLEPRGQKAAVTGSSTSDGSFTVPAPAPKKVPAAGAGTMRAMGLPRLTIWFVSPAASHLDNRLKLLRRSRTLAVFMVIRWYHERVRSIAANRGQAASAASNRSYPYYVGATRYRNLIVELKEPRAGER
jgi:hypothetical protein